MNLKYEKPFLNTEQQIEHLKEKGITFTHTTEEEAKEYLKNNNNLFKISSYRKNYDQINGRYVSLDFAFLQDLAIIDMTIRYTLLQLSLDIEHYVKVDLLRHIEEAGEDGYSICTDYIEQLNKEQYFRLSSELKRCSNSIYTQDLFAKYHLSSPAYENRSDIELPIWVFLEIVPFGRIVDFYRFCSQRFNDKKMNKNFYILLQVKELRNACAHSSCIINNLRDYISSSKPPYSIQNAISKIDGISKITRKKKLNNPRMQQISVLLYAHMHFVTSTGVHNKACTLLKDMIQRIYKNAHYYEDNEIVGSSFLFLKSLIDNWFTIE